MTTIEDGRVYEFIENLYDELNNRDGGYHPLKHDPIVLKSASNEFNMPIEEVKKICSSYNNIAASKQIKKINKLPKKKREERTKELLINLLKNNKDLPFANNEGASSETIESGLDIINEAYIKLAEDIGKNGWTIPMTMGLNQFDRLANIDNNVEIYDNFFSDYYNLNRIKLMIKHVNGSTIESNQKKLFNDCVDAYNKKKYLLCVTALIPILEGALSSFGNDKTDIRMMKICKVKMESTKKERKIINHLVWTSFLNFISSLYEKSYFDKEEPVTINRHWILHGRTQTECKAEDCLRLFNAIYTLITILKYENNK